MQLFPIYYQPILNQFRTNLPAWKADSEKCHRWQGTWKTVMTRHSFSLQEHRMLFKLVLHSIQRDCIVDERNVDLMSDGLYVQATKK